MFNFFHILSPKPLIVRQTLLLSFIYLQPKQISRKQNVHVCDRSKKFNYRSIGRKHQVKFKLTPLLTLPNSNFRHRFTFSFQSTYIVTGLHCTLACREWKIINCYYTIYISLRVRTRMYQINVPYVMFEECTLSNNANTEDEHRNISIG